MNIPSPLFWSKSYILKSWTLILEDYLNLKEINEHRSEGYENALKRLKNLNRKNIENKVTKEIKFAFKEGVNLNYYYKENGFNNTLISFKENISASSTYYDTFYKKIKLKWKRLV